MADKKIKLPGVQIPNMPSPTFPKGGSILSGFGRSSGGGKGPGDRKDPLPVFCFKVELGFGEAFFRSVGGIKYETEVIPVREGGANDTTFNLVGSTKWNNLVLKHGFTGSSGLLAYRDEWLRTFPLGAKRIKTGKIVQLNPDLTSAAEWTFHEAWPCRWEISEFDAAKNELGIETLELAHEGLEFSLTGSR